jgi:tryptophan 2,3-dioxygenase
LPQPSSEPLHAPACALDSHGLSRKPARKHNIRARLAQCCFGLATRIDRKHFYAQMSGGNSLDYELYLQAAALLGCQKSFDELCNPDELQFQIVHQVKKLSMKLLAYTLLDIDERLRERAKQRRVKLVGRCQRILRLMSEQPELLEPTSPTEYQKIRLQLGNGSGQESPRLRVIVPMLPHVWRS